MDLAIPHGHSCISEINTTAHAHAPEHTTIVVWLKMMSKRVKKLGQIVFNDTGTWKSVWDQQILTKRIKSVNMHESSGLKSM